jgi:protein-S-isoprenylcysteine O-methyltransferase Ste14
VNIGYHIIVLYFEYEKKVLTKLFEEKAFKVHAFVSMTLWIVTGLMIIAFQLLDHPKFHDFPPMSIIGGIFLIIGIVLGSLGYLTLGLTRSLHYNFFSEITERVVKKGIYKYIDNPQYEGLFFILLGFALLTDSLYNLVIFLEVLILMVLLKYVEDKPITN